MAILLPTINHIKTIPYDNRYQQFYEDEELQEYEPTRNCICIQKIQYFISLEHLLASYSFVIL